MYRQPCACGMNQTPLPFSITGWPSAASPTPSSVKARPMIYSLNPTIEAAIAALYRMVTPHLLDSTVQEVSANWDPIAKVSKVYVDRGVGTMEFVGELDPEAIVAVTLMLATEAGKSLDAEAGFLNCVLPNGCRYHAAISRVTDGPSFSIRLQH